MIKDMDKYDRKVINEKLKREFRRYSDTYSKLSEAAKMDYLKTAQPGEKVPERVALSGEYAERFQNTINDIRVNVDNLLRPIQEKLEASITDAPSQEAANTIALLSTRKHIDQAEIEHLINRYGDNVQAYNAIKDIASEHDVYLMNHQVLSDLKAVKSLADTPSSFSLMNANSGKATAGMISFVEMSIDSTFPTED